MIKMKINIDVKIQDIDVKI